MSRHPTSERPPPAVARALERAERLGFRRSSLPEVGALLRALATGRRVAELGTGTGAGAAWMADTAREVFTAEFEPELAAAAREVLADSPNVTVLAGDALSTLEPLAPFELVFLDAAPYKQRPLEHAERILRLVEPGGLFVLDDLTPGWPGPDPVREFWLADPRVAGVEVLTTPQTAAIVAGVRPR